MAITFVELNRTGSIVLGRYDNAAGPLTYEVRQPGSTPTRNRIDRTPDLASAAATYWQAGAAD